MYLFQFCTALICVNIPQIIVFFLTIKTLLVDHAFFYYQKFYRDLYILISLNLKHYQL